MKNIVHGDSAVVTGLCTGKGTEPKDNPINGKARFVATWVKMRCEKWRCVVGANIELE
jgi:ketosteroid isomerase-like protein